jgi:uncharacterized RmlC-like cupin family protein
MVTKAAAIFFAARKLCELAMRTSQIFKVKAGDWLLIPPDSPHQPKPDPGGFSYMIMKLNVGIYPWSLVR